MIGGGGGAGMKSRGSRKRKDKLSENNPDDNQPSPEPYPARFRESFHSFYLLAFSATLSKAEMIIGDEKVFKVRIPTNELCFCLG